MNYHCIKITFFHQNFNNNFYLLMAFEIGIAQDNIQEIDELFNHPGEAT